MGVNRLVTPGYTARRRVEGVTDDSCLGLQPQGANRRRWTISFAALHLRHRGICLVTAEICLAGVGEKGNNSKGSSWSLIDDIQLQYYASVIIFVGLDIR